MGTTDCPDSGSCYCKCDTTWTNCVDEGSSRGVAVIHCYIHLPRTLHMKRRGCHANCTPPPGKK